LFNHTNALQEHESNCPSTTLKRRGYLQQIGAISSVGTTTIPLHFEPKKMPKKCPKNGGNGHLWVKLLGLKKYVQAKNCSIVTIRSQFHLHVEFV